LRALVTGASGFAGRHLVRACVEAGNEVVGVSRSAGDGEPGVSFHRVDLRDADGVMAVMSEVTPQVIYHLAALSSVGRSWEEPAVTMRDNTATAVNVLEAMRRHAPGARLVWVSSCEVYGPSAELPITERAPVQPANPYAVSKTAGDLLAGVYADAHGLEIVRARPFSHTGPGQQPSFIVSSLARQAAAARLAGETRLRIVTGNPDTRRDFTDVRDVARAYRLLAECGHCEIYNVASGRSISAAEHVALIADLIAPIEVEHVIDPARVRAHEVMDLCGANDRILADTGWRPEIPFRQTMLDTLDWWETELAAEVTRS
jgi:GDP-4-dehydro-6-deoxy-D-mannose reductase